MILTSISVCKMISRNLGEDTGRHTPHKDQLYATMSKFGIPAKLIRLCEMTLKNGQCVVKIGNN